MSDDRGTQTNRSHKVSVSSASTSKEPPAAESEKQSEAGSVSIDCSRDEDVKSFDLSSSESVFSCKFEVFGIVQGVSFRMYTLRRAQKLGVRGWCQNTTTNTVKGEIEGHQNPFEEMRLWLKYTGSPTSRIDKVVFTETIESSRFNFDKFSILVD